MTTISGDISKRSENQQKLLFEIIKRYDAYIGAANTKIAIILSYCMAYIGGIAFKIIDLIAKRDHNWTWWLPIVSAGISIAVTFYSAYRAYEALNPQMPSGRANHEKPSIIFFGDVSGLNGGRDGYVHRINEITDAEIVEDLSRQAHVLANIVSRKMALLNQSTQAIAIIQLPLSLLTILLLCII